MTQIQFLMTELKLDREAAISLQAFLSGWKHSHRAGVEQALERQAWRKRRDIIKNPNIVSDRILGYRLGAADAFHADGQDDVVKFFDNLADGIAQHSRGIEY